MNMNVSDDALADSLVELATSHHQHGRFEQAFETLFQVAELYRMQERPELAAQAFRKLLRLETSDIELQLALVQNFLEMQLYEEATEAFCLCASHFDTLGMLDRFLDLANQLLEIDPDLMDVRNKVIDVLLRDTEIYLSYNLYGQARSALERALAHFPHSIRIHKMMLRLVKKTADSREQLPWLLKLAQLTRDDAKTSCQYLSCALSLTDEHEEIFEFADAIQVDFRRSSSLITCIGDEITLTPAESSAPESDENTDNDEHTTPQHLSLRQRLTLKMKNVAPPASGHELVMLQRVLRAVEECKEPTILTIRANQTEQGPHAELVVFGGALSPGIRLNGESLTAQNNQGNATRDDLRKLVTDALLDIARAFEGIEFELQKTTADPDITRIHAFPALSILMELARSFSDHAKTTIAAQFFQAATPLAEQGWLFMNPPPGILFPLPIASIHNIETTFESIDVFSRALSARDSFIRRIFSQNGEYQNQGPVLTHLIVTDTSYACMSCPGFMALVQIEHQKTGQLLQVARQFIGKHDP